jgi:hypothetical protein
MRLFGDDTRRLAHIFWWSFICAAVQYGTSLVLGYLHFANTAMRLLPSLFIGIAIAALIASRAPRQYLPAFPPAGLLLLGIGFLFFNAEVPLSLILPLTWALLYAPLVHALFFSQFSRNYYSDLFGALLGFVVAIAIIPLVGVETVFLLCLVGASWIAFSTSSFDLVRYDGKAILVIAALAVGCSVISASTIDIAKLAYTFPDKPSPEAAYAVLGATEDNSLHVLAYRWSPIARVDVAHNSADGYTALFYDRMRWATFATTTNSAPFYSLLPTTTPRTSALVIGVGAGRDMLSLDALGFNTVTGVEVNDATAALLRTTFSKETADVYNRFPIVVGDGRAYIESHTNVFDLIALPRADMSSSPSRDYVTPDAYLYTEEALHSYWDHLSEDGVLWISRGAFFYDTNDLLPSHAKSIITIRSFLSQRGLNSEDHVFVFSEVSPDVSARSIRLADPREERRMWHAVLFKKPLSEAQKQELEQRMSRLSSDAHLITTTSGITPPWPSEICLRDALTASSLPPCAQGMTTLTDNAPFLWVGNPTFFVHAFTQKPSHTVFVVLTIVSLIAVWFFARTHIANDHQARILYAILFLSGLQFGFLFSVFYHAIAIALPSPILTSVVVQVGTLVGCIVGAFLVYRYSARLISAYVLAGIVGIALLVTTPFMHALLTLSNSSLRIGAVLMVIIVTTTFLATAFPKAITLMVQRAQSPYLGFALNSIGIAVGMYTSILCMVLYGIHALSVIAIVLALMTSMLYVVVKK